MEKITCTGRTDGFARGEGLSLGKLTEIKAACDAAGFVTELRDLVRYLPPRVRDEAEGAWVLIVRGGAEFMAGEGGADRLFREHRSLRPDTKAKMRGKVKNKLARHNLCFADYDSRHDFEAGKGTVVSFERLPATKAMRQKVISLIGPITEGLPAEANYYYDASKCGIGFHGDGERRLVVAVRLGASIPLHYQWFRNSAPVGDRAEFILHHGDVYFMSEKAVGTDWMCRKPLTLRHAAGADKYLNIKGQGIVVHGGRVKSAPMYYHLPSIDPEEEARAVAQAQEEREERRRLKKERKKKEKEERKKAKKEAKRKDKEERKRAKKEAKRKDKEERKKARMALKTESKEHGAGMCAPDSELPKPEDLEGRDDSTVDGRESEGDDGHGRSEGLDVSAADVGVGVGM